MKLVIMESPHKAQTVGNFLGKEYKVVASAGHIRDLKVGDKDHYLGIDIENNFKPLYENLPNKASIIKKLQAQCKLADDVYIATDPDREGEAIAYSIAYVLGLDIDKVKRMEMHEITYQAAQEAIKNPRKIDMNLIQAQETRRIIDRIIGFDLSQQVKKTIKVDDTNTQSAGRVQSAVLKMIVDKEKAIKDFNSEDYYQIKAIFQINDKEIKANLVNLDNLKAFDFKDENEVKEVLSRLKKAPVAISDIKVEEKQSASAPVYTTSSLLQEASTQLKMSSTTTMKVAQKLYEGLTLKNSKYPVGLITYMRTDSVRINPSFINKGKDFILKTYGTQYVGKAKVGSIDKNAQDAHEGIRPTDIAITPEEVKAVASPDEYKLYKLIYEKTLASLMANEIYEETKVIFKVDDRYFLATGERTTFDGFTKIKASKREPLPTIIDMNSKVDGSKYNLKALKTNPPARYSEAKLIQAMKNEGIGRPSTYATTISTLRSRHYVSVEKNEFVPTELGFAVTNYLDEWFSYLINIEYTSEMENALDEIADGKLDEKDTIKEFYDHFQSALKEAKSNKTSIYVENEKKDYGLCPECGKPLIQRHTKKYPYQTFIGCSGYPDCTYIYKNPKIGQECPECHKGILQIRKGKYGQFLGCSNYPKCKYLEKI